MLFDLSKNFYQIHWSMLTILSCDKDGAILPFEDLHSITISEFSNLLKAHMGRPLAEYLRNFNLAVLQGANAVSLRSGQVDRRSKEISITNNGYRLLEHFISGGIRIA